MGGRLAFDYALTPGVLAIGLAGTGEDRTADRSRPSAVAGCGKMNGGASVGSLTHIWCRAFDGFPVAHGGLDDNTRSRGCFHRLLRIYSVREK